MKLLAILCALFLTNLTHAAQTEASTFEVKTVVVGTKELYVEVAQTPIEREHGLMNRETVAPYDGMLFVFDHPQRAAFWMKDTPMELEVGFFNHNGILMEIHDLLPMSTITVTSFSKDILYALELPKGGFERHGLQVGQKIFVP